MSYDPYVRVWVDDRPRVAQGSGASLTLASGGEDDDSRVCVAISRHQGAADEGAALYWRMTGITEVGSESVLFAVAGPAEPYVTLGFGFEFVHYPEGASENWTGNPSINAAVGLRSKKVYPARWFLEGRGSLWVWLPGFPQWPFESVWGRGLALSAGVDFSF